MWLDSPTTAEFLAVASNMRHKDFVEFIALSPTDTREDLAALLTERYGSHESLIAVRRKADEPPVAIGGLIEARPNVVTLLFFATDDFPDVALPLARFSKRQLFPRLFAAGVHRIECVSMSGYEESHRWIEALGLRQEAPPLAAYGKNREDFLQFSLVSDAGPAGD